MAVKYAISAGNFNSGAIWNDGIIPTENDDVYLNGYNVTLNIDYITNGIISNGICPSTNNGGGYFTYSTNRIVEANQVEAYSGYLFNSTSNVSLTIRANNILCPVSENPFAYVGYTATRRSFSFIANEINCRNGTLIHSQYGSWSCVITGNLVTSNAAMASTQSGTSTLIINGNVVLNGSLGTSLTATINGNITANNNASIPTLTINGNITANNNAIVSGTTLNLNGNIKYVNTANKNGINYTNINILNPDSFVWQDITEPRTNLFFIVTNAELENLVQYPTETDVKNGVSYAFGQLVGTYLPDYPPETVVLKDYAYDGGEMVGTYEGGGTVQNTINVYPYKRRNH